MNKPHPFILMPGATVVDTHPRGIQIAVVLDTDPQSSRRIWFPKSQIWNDGAGHIFASRWILQRKNRDLKARGESIILVDVEKGFYLNSLNP